MEAAWRGGGRKEGVGGYAASLPFSVEVADSSQHRRITGREALHYVPLFRYNHRSAITPRRHQGPGCDTRIDAPETQRLLQHNKQHH